MSDIPSGSCPEPFSFLQLASVGGSAQRPSHAGGAQSDDPSPRLVIRGETLVGKPSAIIDWLTFTVRVSDGHVRESILRFLSDAITDPALTLVQMNRGASGYSHSGILGLPTLGESAHVGVMAWGGSSQRGTIMVALPGTFCARITSWPFVEKTLADWDATITRVDLAHDDVAGTMSIEDALRMYEAGAFNSGGRRPRIEPRGNWINNEGLGRTLYIGKRANGKCLRIYEKGCQLGDRDSPWVRYEVELHKKDRYIPHDILTDPGRYLAGCYPALSHLSDQPTRLKTQKRVAKTTLDHLTRVASIACGKTINALHKQGHDAETIVSLLMRPGLPKRLILPSASLPCGTHYILARDGDD